MTGKIWAAAALWLAATPVAAACQLGQMAEMKVVMNGNRPYVQGSINGRPMLALADTGAEYSVLWREAAPRYGLKPKFFDGLKFVGVGGERAAYQVVIPEFSLGGPPRKNARFLSVNGGRQEREDEAMLLGQDVLGAGDLEFDLANNAIRLLKPVGCGAEPLAYWATTSYAVADLVSMPDDQERIHVDVKLNGATVRAVIDSGAYTSVISPQGARRAGIGLDDPGVVRDGTAGGIGRRTLDAYVATFGTFQIGDQTIKNAKLRIADIFGAGRSQTYTGSRIAYIDERTPQMLLGADFLRSHRVLFSFEQKKMYFTYNGGKVFQTEGPLIDESPNETESSTETPRNPTSN